MRVSKYRLNPESQKETAERASSSLFVIKKIYSYKCPLNAMTSRNLCTSRVAFKGRTRVHTGLDKQYLESEIIDYIDYMTCSGWPYARDGLKSLPETLNNA